MTRALALGLFVAVLGSSGAARASEPEASPSPEPAFADRFFRGTSPGELGAPKVLVVSTLYAASLASFVAGVVSLVHAQNQGERALEYKLDQPPGFCNELASVACREYRALFAEEHETRATGLLLLGVGGLTALGGALTAELWQNETSAPRVAVSVSGAGAALTAAGSF